MDIFSTLITRPMGFIIQLIYTGIPNYGLAIILFTVLVTAILFPLNYKSQKSMAKQQKLAPMLAELQKKYANDKQKLNVEMSKLYKENGVSMAGGCLPMLIQFPVMIGLYQVIIKPLSFMKGINFNQPEVIDTVKTIMNNVIAIDPGSKLAGITMETAANNYQIQLAHGATRLMQDPGAIKMFEGAVVNHQQVVEIGQKFVIDFNFLGLDLSRVPSELFAIFQGKFEWELLLLLIIPLIATLLTWVSSKMTPNPSAAQTTAEKPSRPTGKEPEAPNMTAQMGKSMTLMMPIMTLVFTFTLPIGIGLYWVASSGARIIQQYFMNKHFSKKKDEIDVKPIETNNKNRKKHR